MILQSNIQATTVSGTLPVAWSSSTSCPELLFRHTPHWPSSQAPQFCCPPPAEDQPHRGHLLRWRHSSHGLQAGEQRSQSPSSVAGMVYSSFYLLGKKKTKFLTFSRNTNVQNKESFYWQTTLVPVSNS